MKPIGLLYDNISGNTGDLAIGLSVRKMLLDLGYKNNQIVDMIPGISNPKDYRKIIIGGGLLLRQRGDFFYDKFRLTGNHILNSMGILGHPQDLSYLNQYSYLSVRSSIDKSKLDYLATNVNVVPCTTLLLDDISTDIKIEKPSIGIHCFDRQNFDQIVLFIKKYLPDFHIYLLPITFYNYDYEFQQRICDAINHPHLHILPTLKPLEVFTIIGKFNYFVSYSLHGALFSYRHNVPFILLNNIHDSKMSAFMTDRQLDKYLFNDSNHLEQKFQLLISTNPDYSHIFSQDIKLLNQHKLHIKNAIENNSSLPINLQKINARIKSLHASKSLLNKQINKINSSPFYKLNQLLHKLVQK